MPPQWTVEFEGKLARTKVLNGQVIGEGRFSLSDTSKWNPFVVFELDDFQCFGQHRAYLLGGVFICETDLVLSTGASDGWSEHFRRLP